MPTSERRASDLLFDEIMLSRNSLRRQNIELVKVACDQMEKDKVVISAAEVARRTGDAGPAYSTLVNKDSRLGEYIKCRIVEQAALPKQPRSESHSLANDTSDPVLKAQIRDLESTVRWQRKENIGIRHLVKHLSPGVDIDKALAKATSGQNLSLVAAMAPALAATAAPVDNALRGVLLKLMDHLVSDRAYRETRGRLTINLKPVLSQQEMGVYKKASGLSDEDWTRRYGHGVEEQDGER